jgi:hypothetical protein
VHRRSLLLMPSKKKSKIAKTSGNTAQNSANPSEPPISQDNTESASQAEQPQENVNKASTDVLDIRAQGGTDTVSILPHLFCLVCLD